MKHFCLSTLLLALMVTPAVAASVTWDWDHHTDFHAYRTFTFRKGTPLSSAVAQSHIDQTLEALLSEKGLTRSEGDADLIVVTYGRSSSKTEIDVDRFGYAGVRWQGWVAWGPTVINISDVAVGMLVVDLLDGGTGELVWRTVARDTIPEKPEKGAKKVGGALSKAFKDFPPGRE